MKILIQKQLKKIKAQASKAAAFIYRKIRIHKIKTFIDNKIAVTDILSISIITFGVVLVVAGLFLMITDVMIPSQTTSTKFGVATLSFLPGVPFSVGDLANSSLSVLGLVSWIVGMDLVLVGLGLWVRHKLARFVALTIFSLSMIFQFVQFLLSGILGSPTSVVQIVVNGLVVFLLFSRFDFEKQSYKKH